MTKYSVLEEIPDEPRSRHRFPWNKCQVGGGFMLEADDPATKTIRQNVWAVNSRAKKQGAPTRFTVFKDANTGCMWVKRIS